MHTDWDQDSALDQIRPRSFRAGGRNGGSGARSEHQTRRESA